jgi:hypothetical protein
MRPDPVPAGGCGPRFLAGDAAVTGGGLSPEPRRGRPAAQSRTPDRVTWLWQHRQMTADPSPSAPASLAEFGALQVLAAVNLRPWQWDAAIVAGLIPPADVEDRRWSSKLVDQLVARRDEILAVVGTEPPIGGHRATQRVAARTGIDVTKDDLEAGGGVEVGR